MKLSRYKQNNLLVTIDCALESAQDHDYAGAIKRLAEAIAIIMGDWSGTGNEREDITGLSTRGTNKNFGNSGFAGGCTLFSGQSP